MAITHLTERVKYSQAKRDFLDNIEDLARKGILASRLVSPLAGDRPSHPFAARVRQKSITPAARGQLSFGLRLNRLIRRNSARLFPDDWRNQAIALTILPTSDCLCKGDLR
jgi:hypothetical protein